MFRPQAASILSQRYIVAGILAAVSLCYILLYSDLELAAFSSSIGTLYATHVGAGDEWMSEEHFVAKALQNDIYTRTYNGTAVRKLCSEAEWRDDVVMSCDMLAGGIGNLRPNLLACLRYAIESGAKLIPPVIHLRVAFELMKSSFDWSKGTDLSYMFDTDYLYDTLAEDCPQLQFVNESDPSIHIPPRNDALTINPKKMFEDNFWGHVLKDPSRFRAALDATIQQTIDAKDLQPTAEHPFRLSFDDGISFSWPINYDNEDFRSDWGHLARLPQRIRALSARILYRLYRKLGAQQDPSRPSTDTFLGAHIRTEGDAAVEGWTSFETQAAQVRNELVTTNVNAVYVATGKASDAKQLQKFLATVQIPTRNMEASGSETRNVTEGVQVLQKWDFMDDEDLLLADSLTWDQMALLDLDVMLRASRFVGIWESSWSWTIALKRHELSEENPYDYEAHRLTFQDEYSILYGPEGAQAIIAPCFWL